MVSTRASSIDGMRRMSVGLLKKPATPLTGKLVDLRDHVAFSSAEDEAMVCAAAAA